MSASRNGKPFSVKFSPEEEAWLDQMQARTGFPRGEIIRRSVRLLRREAEKQKSIDFVLELTPNRITFLEMKMVAEDAPKYGTPRKKKSPDGSLQPRSSTS